MGIHPVATSVLIVGSGVFGLSTALALKSRPQYKNVPVVVLDKSQFPAQDGASIDSSRLVRPDYADAAYARLALRAQELWRTEYKDVYSECGLVLVAEEEEGLKYVNESFRNVQGLGCKVEPLEDRGEIARVMGTGGAMGIAGYVNWESAFVDAEAAMKKLKAKCDEVGVEFRVENVLELAYEEGENGERRCSGVITESGKRIKASLTILASGAWTPGLVDLRTQIISTGQIMAYIELTIAEQAHYENMPIILDLTSGTFIVPPRSRILKVARHSNGYINTTHTPFGPISLPATALSHPALSLPTEASTALTQAVAKVIPNLQGQPFSQTRMCWYSDTPNGDFLCTYHPTIPGLFLATGGSGHAFKFLPVLGEEIVQVLEGGGEFKEKWAWKKDVSWAGDGSRGGQKGGEGELLGEVKTKL